MKSYNTFSFLGEIDWDSVPEEKLEFSNWSPGFTFNTYFRMCFRKNDGIYVRMRSDETDLVAVHKNRDDPVWQDSCMEFFICAVEGREEYINFEMNSVGAFLTEFGKGKNNRVCLCTLTDKEPTVSTQVSSCGWSLELYIPCSLISEVYCSVFDASACEIKGNFYKCGDETGHKHYDSFTRMSTLPPGFHNPDLFANIKIIER